MTARAAVVTIAAGRHRHLRRQCRGLAAGPAPDLQVVAAMGDPDVRAVLAAEDVPWPVRVVDVPVPASGDLPLAAARNAAVTAALDDGAELLVLLDVDCVPAAGLLPGYRAAASATVSHEPALLCGTVRYLPPLAAGADYDLGALDRVSAPHPARPAPAPGQVLPAEDLRLFWSLSFAVTARSWRAAGGFDEAYVGYGGEDTDLAMRVQRAGGSMWWVGGADAYHQHHDSQVPPLRHVRSITRNANLFHQRWGWYPMAGWLDDLADRGLASHGPDGWTATPQASAATA